MALLINTGGERDLEQGLVELDEEQHIGFFEIGEIKREPIIAELNTAFIGLKKFACFFVIISIVFIFTVLRALTESDKDRSPIAYNVFLVATFSSILVGIVIRFGRALHRKRIGPALPAKRIMLIGNVLLCTSEGFFIVSIFAAVYLLVSFQLRWVAIGVALGIWLVLVAFVALLDAKLELRTGFEGITTLTSLALAFRFSDLFAGLLFSHRP